jgi:hypothetical protein
MIEVRRVYSYKGHDYVVLAKVAVKDPSSGYWEDSILYARVDQEPGLYVRSEDDFSARFQQTEKQRLQLLDWTALTIKLITTAGMAGHETFRLLY